MSLWTLMSHLSISTNGGMALSAMKTHSLLVGYLPYVYRFSLFI